MSKGQVARKEPDSWYDWYYHANGEVFDLNVDDGPYAFEVGGWVSEGSPAFYAWCLFDDRFWSPVYQFKGDAWHAAVQHLKGNQ